MIILQVCELENMFPTHHNSWGKEWVWTPKMCKFKGQWAGITLSTNKEATKQEQITWQYKPVKFHKCVSV